MTINNNFNAERLNSALHFTDKSYQPKVAPNPNFQVAANFDSSVQKSQTFSNQLVNVPPQNDGVTRQASSDQENETSQSLRRSQQYQHKYRYLDDAED